MNTNENLYDILGVDKNASKEEIKRAYKKFSKHYHPDMEDGDEEMFKKISYSYDVLMDDNKRANYDKFGSTKGGPQGGGGFSPFGEDPFGGDNPFDAGFFSGAFERARRQKQKKRKEKGRDLKVELDVDIKEIFDESTKKINYYRNFACTECNGRGVKGDPKKCTTCNGEGSVQGGEVRTSMGHFIKTYICNDCGGEGVMFDTFCDKCNGNGTNKVKEGLDIKLRPTLAHGDKIPYIGYGDHEKNADRPGDLIIIVKETPHKEFYRDGNKYDIGKTVHLNYEDFILGKDDLKIRTISDKTIYVKVPESVKPDTKLRIKGEGMYMDNNYWNRGNMFLKLKVHVPDELSSEEKELLEQLKAIREPEPD